MMTVRYPSGVAVTYNDACHLKYGSAAWEIYTADPGKGGRWIASIQVSANVCVEVQLPCRVEAPPVFSGEQALRWLLDHARQLSYRELALLADLKRLLQAFDARRQTWRK